jgi:hypothetical protein
MKTKRLFSMLLLLTLLLGACQSQTAETPAAPAATAVPSSKTPQSPIAVETPQQDSSALTAKLSELAGTVELKEADQSAFSPASADMQLNVNGQIQTGTDGKVRLDLSSGTIIRVAPSSIFTLVSNEPAQGGGLLTKIKMELGMVFVILNGGRADVETPAGLAAVRGSYLMTSYDPATKQLTLTCLEGHCQVGLSDGTTKEFTNSQKIVISQNTEGQWVVTFDGQMSPEDFQTWLSFNPEAEDLVRQAMGGNLPGDSNPGGNDGGGACSISMTAPQGNLPLSATNFEWTPVENASSYVLTFTPKVGQPFTFVVEPPATSKDVDLGAILSSGADVSWSVSAMDTNNNVLCASEPVTTTIPVPEARPQDKNDEESRPTECPTQPPY